MSSEKERWDTRYAEQEKSDIAPGPAKVLRDYAYLLPEEGRALDVACGLGGNALFLARHGLTVSAWDISSVAIEQLNSFAQVDGVSIDAQVHNVSIAPPAAQSFDVVSVRRFLDRDLFPRLIEALRAHGLLFYQTFIVDKDPTIGPSNPAYLLAQNELLQLCSGLQILAYQEEGQVGDMKRGFRNEALIVAQRL